jgi:hypothetical protein
LGAKSVQFKPTHSKDHIFTTFSLKNVLINYLIFKLLINYVNYTTISFHFCIKKLVRRK